ncbi:MAG: LD-carboxypeptidase, partial [Oscillospiraceae bacterium]|nr:LD-carboxypeptidase [Oscillospiraceae bacterium]
MRYPEPLKRNGTIGLVAPSYGCATEPYITRLEAALAEARRRGFSVTEEPHVRLDEAFGRSGPADVLGAELNSAYLSPDNEALISVGGGELMCEVVPYIDFEAIASAKPKWYMGFSDNTNFTFLSATLADTAAIYGPCFPALGITPWHKSITDAVGLLTGEISS